MATINVKILAASAMAIHKAGKTMDDLVLKYTSAQKGSEDWQTTKQNLTQALTNLRKDLRTRLMKSKAAGGMGLTEDEANEKILKVVPNFRANRQTKRKDAVADLFAELEAMDEEEKDELDEVLDGEESDEESEDESEENAENPAPEVVA